MNQPNYVKTLQDYYGAPSQEGFGSAVFFEILENAGELEKSAKHYYEYFVGKLWKQFGEQAWLESWKQVYKRSENSKKEIAGELSAITDSSVTNSVPMIMDVVQDADKARLALSAAYDDPSVMDLQVFNIGDGGAMSGLIIAGRRSNAEATYLVFLMD